MGDRIYSMKRPNGGAIKNIGFERDVSILNGYTTAGKVMRKSLFAFAKSTAGSMYATSFTSNNGVGGTGSKTVLTGNKFPIGCKIYYYNGNVDIVAADLSNGNFTSLITYRSFEAVNARYTAVTGTSVNLNNGAFSDVYLRVELVDNDRYWQPVYKEGQTNEIIVTADNLVDGGYYIHLGKTSGSNNYTFQLEDNNQLYFYGNTATSGSPVYDLIPYYIKHTDDLCGDIESLLAAI